MGRRQSSQLAASIARTGESGQADDIIYQSRGRIPQEETSSLPPPILSPNAKQQSNISRKSASRPDVSPVTTEFVDSVQDRPYDLTPVSARSRRKPSTPSYTIDPYEFSPLTTPVHEREMRYVDPCLKPIVLSWLFAFVHLLINDPLCCV